MIIKISVQYGLPQNESRSFERKNNRDEKKMISAIFTKNNKLFKGNEDDYHKILASIFFSFLWTCWQIPLNKIIQNNLCLNYVMIKKDL